MFFKTLKLFSVLSRGTVFSLLKNIAGEVLYFLNKNDLNHLYEYWKRYIKKNEPFKRVVLVDLLFEHPGTNNNTLLVSSLIASKESTKRIGLTDLPIRWRLKRFANAYGVVLFLSVFNWKGFLYHIKSCSFIFRNLLNLKYDKNFGISIVIDGQEIGDLIYDQFMRETYQPTIRSASLLFYVYVFKYVAIYYRYIDIIRNEKVTDIVLSHNVYAQFGLIARASATVDLNIKVWQWYGTSPININCHKVRKSYIRMPRHYIKEYGELIHDFLGFDGVEKLYNELSYVRYNALDKNQVDLAYVYENTEINELDEFNKLYNPKKDVSFIYSHAFVDAVKYTDWQLFSDYYTWLENTLIFLVDKSKSGSIFVKAHPSESMYPCKYTVEHLVEEINNKYNAGFIFLDKKINNHLVFELANSIVTCSGTIAMEASCFGIPCITAASSLYEESDAVYQATTINQYKDLLNNIYSIKFLDEEKIYSAKLVFLWLSKFVYSNADFLTLTDGSLEVNYYLECKRINDCYRDSKDLYSQDLYKSFETLCSGKFFDSISFSKGDD